jgi:predicted RNase H-like HicB family nuclease
MELTWTGVFETVEGGWVQARIAEVPGVITVGPTHEQARKLLVDALREYLLSLGEGEPHPPVPETAHRESVHVVIGAA